MVTGILGTFSRADAVAQRFGVKREMVLPGARWRELAYSAAGELADKCRPGRLVLIRGSSGSGKTLLMRALMEVLSQRAISTAAGVVAGRLVVDSLPWLELEEALEVLGRFGLGEVYSYLSPADQLSAGQQSRLRLAMAYARAKGMPGRVLLSDEFATQLDRFSAAVIARNLRRVIDADGAICAVVATCHDDLATPLRPDLMVSCDFGEYVIEEKPC